MIRSMTAYGRGEYRQDDTMYIAEIRAVNHRYLDIVLRMPKIFIAFEKDLKTIIASKTKRGRIEVFIEIKNEGGVIPYDLELNLPLAKSYYNIFNQLAKELDLDQTIQINSLLKMEDVVASKPAEINLEKVRHSIQEALLQALEPLDMMRRREGEAIEADFRYRIDLLEKYLNEIEKRSPELIEEHRNRIKNNLDRILKDVAVDENRLAQEIAFFAEKTDITEEIVRAKSHFSQFLEYLQVDDAIGRRLDFLIQEINREINTVGSKTSDPIASKIVVEMKGELEKLREQVQNVE